MVSIHAHDHHHAFKTHMPDLGEFSWSQCMLTTTTSCQVVRCYRDHLKQLDARRNKDHEQLSQAVDATQRLEYAPPKPFSSTQSFTASLAFCLHMLLLPWLPGWHMLLLAWQACEQSQPSAATSPGDHSRTAGGLAAVLTHTCRLQHLLLRKLRLSQQVWHSSHMADGSIALRQLASIH